VFENINSEIWSNFFSSRKLYWSLTNKMETHHFLLLQHQILLVTCWKFGGLMLRMIRGLQ